MKIFEGIVKRRTIRRFKDKPVPYEVLEKCVEAARLAPTGRNRQTCEYIVIDDPAVAAGVFENIGGSIRETPAKGGPGPGQAAKAYIIVLINKNYEQPFKTRRMAYFDVGMAAENITLVALEQGIGSCAILTFDESVLKLILDIPEDRDIGIIMAMGYPDESPVTEVVADSITPWVDKKGVRHVPKRKLADILHRNIFQLK